MLSKRKGSDNFIIMVSTNACAETLPKTALTEWLFLDGSASLHVIVKDVTRASFRQCIKKHAPLETMVIRKIVVPHRGERTNREWLENEQKELSKKSDGAHVYIICYSTCGKYGCLCKLTKAYAIRKSLL